MVTGAVTITLLNEASIVGNVTGIPGKFHCSLCPCQPSHIFDLGAQLTIEAGDFFAMEGVVVGLSLFVVSSATKFTSTATSVISCTGTSNVSTGGGTVSGIFSGGGSHGGSGGSYITTNFGVPYDLYNTPSQFGSKGGDAYNATRM